MPIDFTLTPEQLRLRGDARAFARDVLSKVESATRDLPTPLARFAATRPFYEQTVAAGFLRVLLELHLHVRQVSDEVDALGFRGDLKPGNETQRLNAVEIEVENDERRLFVMGLFDHLRCFFDELERQVGALGRFGEFN